MYATDHHINGIRIARELMPTLGMPIPDSLWREFPLDFGRENAAFSMHRQLQFYRRLIEIMDDPLLGLKMSALFPLQAYGMFGYAMMAAPDIRTSLRLADRFDRLTYTLQALHFMERDGMGILQFTATGLNLDPVLKTYFADRDLASSAIGARGTAMDDLHTALKVTFEHGDGGHARAYEDFFRCPVEFSAPSNSVTFSAQQLDRPNPYRNAAAFELCVRECERQLSELADNRDIAGRVRDELFQRPGYLQDIESIARQLGTSARTLRRRLEETGTSFTELQQDVRFQQAREQLRNRKLSITEVATMLGYSEAGNFTTAFKRWSGGISPRAYRQSLSAGAGA
ncbi:AraC family transcriptional regulator [Haliea atlantica]